MSEALTIAVTSELKAAEPTIGEALITLQDRLNALPAAEIVAVIEGMSRALASRSRQSVPGLDGMRKIPMSEHIEAELNVLLRSFERRRELLAGALSTSQVASLLGTTRQTPHDRIASGSLLAAMDRGGLRFPRWQFDPDGEDGVVSGLPSVIRALDVSSIAKISWLTRPNPMLDGETPLARLQAGDAENVLSLAYGVGIG